MARRKKLKRPKVATDPNGAPSGAREQPQNQPQTVLVGSLLVTLLLGIWQCLAGHWNEPATKVLCFLFITICLGWYVEHHYRARAPLKPPLIRGGSIWALFAILIAIWWADSKVRSFSVNVRT